MPKISLPQHNVLLALAGIGDAATLVVGPGDRVSFADGGRPAAEAAIRPPQTPRIATLRALEGGGFVEAVQGAAIPTYRLTAKGKAEVVSDAAPPTAPEAAKPTAARKEPPPDAPPRPRERTRGSKHPERSARRRARKDAQIAKRARREGDVAA